MLSQSKGDPKRTCMDYLKYQAVKNMNPDDRIQAKDEKKKKGNIINLCIMTQKSYGKVLACCYFMLMFSDLICFPPLYKQQK